MSKTKDVLLINSTTFLWLQQNILVTNQGMDFKISWRAELSYPSPWPCESDLKLQFLKRPGLENAHHSVTRETSAAECHGNNTKGTLQVCANDLLQRTLRFQKSFIGNTKGDGKRGQYFLSHFGVHTFKGIMGRDFELT